MNVTRDQLHAQLAAKPMPLHIRPAVRRALIARGYGAEWAQALDASRLASHLDAIGFDIALEELNSY